MKDKSLTDEEIMQMASETYLAFLSSFPKLIKCLNCGADNCVNNESCVGCNSQL